MKLEKWGDSLAVRIPSAVVAALALKEGDEIEFHISGRKEWAVVRSPSREELITWLRAFRGRLPADFRFDRDEANAR